MLNSILNLFSYIKIRAKVLVGMALILLLLVVVSVSAIFSLSRTKNDIENVVFHRQPATIVSLELADALDRANAALGFYLSSVAENDKQAYFDALANLDIVLAKINKMPAVLEDAKTVALVAEIAEDIEKYKAYRDIMTELAVDFIKNFPGIGISGLKLNPIAMSIQAHLHNMMSVELEEDVSVERRQLFYEMAILRQHWMNVLIGARAYMAFRGQKDIDNMLLYKSVFETQLNKLGEMAELLNFEQQDAYEQIKKQHTEYYRRLDDMVKVHGGDKWRTDSYLIKTEIGPLVTKIKNKINNLVKSQTSLTEKISQDLVDNVSKTRSVVSGLLGIALLVGVLISLLMAYLITKPLNKAVDAMVDIAQGEGDLTQRLEVIGRDETAQLAVAFNRFIEKIHGIIGQLSNSTSQLAAASEQMSVIVEDTRQGIQRQRSDTDSVATAMTQMVSSMQEVVRSANSAAEMAQHADQQAMTGKSVVARTMQSIEALAGEVDTVSNVINGLENESEQIGSVLDVIQGIAEQTNLLALNAAIEAARAGEQGRGFAVVADEVRSLASRTQQSTQEIQAMIERLQSGAKNAVNVMKIGTGQAGQSVSQADEASTALEQITAAITNIAQKNIEIAHAAHEQESVSEEIDANIINISQVADASANSTEDMARSSASLAQLAAELQNMVAQFKIQ